MTGKHCIRNLGLVAALAEPALAQDTLPLADLLGSTHVHGPGAGGEETLTLATHNGLWAVELKRLTATRLGQSKGDFMGYSAGPDSPGTAYASGHPVIGGNMGIIRTEDAGQSWAYVSDGLNGPVDFHSMEVKRADSQVIYGIGHDARVQHSADGGVTWQAPGTAPERLIDIATSHDDADMLYAVTETGLFLSPDRGATWKPVIDGVPVSTIDAGADGVVRAVDLGRGLVTVGAGGEISTVSADLPDGFLLYLATTSADPLRLAALSAKGRLDVSDDAGLTWTDVLATE